jgi:hypothetical protein
MPRKIRFLSLAISLIVLAGLAGQAAQAAPLAQGARWTETSAGDYLASVWGWFTAKASSLGQVAFRHLPGAWEKDGGAGDPNNGPTTGGTGSGGTGSKGSMVGPIGIAVP